MFNTQAMLVLHRLMNGAKEAPADKKATAYYIVLRAMLLARKNGELAEVSCRRFLAECPTEGKELKTLRFRYDNEIAGIIQAKRERTPIRKGRAARERERATTQRSHQAAAVAISAQA